MISRRSVVGAALGAAGALALAAGQTAQAQDERSYLLATAGTGGTY